MTASFVDRLLQVPAVRALAAPALAARRAVLARRAATRRAVLGRLRAVLAEDPVLRLDAFGGAFALDARSHLFERVAADGDYEPDLAALCRRHLDPARDAVDVGGNVGFFTVLMAGALPGRRVLSIEPTPGAYARLVANVARNGLSDRVVVFNGVAAEDDAARTMSVIDGLEEYASLGALVHPAVSGAVSRRVDVAAKTVDALVDAHGLTPGFIKVDVEGAELSVLRGARETLARHRPVVLAELSRPLLAAQGATPEAVFAFFDGLGYTLSDPSHPGARLGQRDFGDLLALPG